MAESARTLLIDTTGFLFRAFHALRETVSMTRDDGYPTGAIYVTVNMLMRLLQRHPADRIACVMDAKGKTFRHSMYPEYKANRPDIDPDLARQIEPLKRFISAMGLKLACISGVEADDVIATLRRQAVAAGMKVTISTGDKDLMQLVDDSTSIVDTLKSEERRYGPEEVFEKYGVRPDQIVDYLALAGDASDNVKGVEKVGPKTAAKWLAQYGTLDAIVEHSGEIKGVVGQNLRNAIDRVLFNRNLIGVRHDVDLDFSLEDLAPRAPEEEELRKLCSEYQLRFADRLLASLGTADSAEEEPVAALPAALVADSAAVLHEWLGKNVSDGRAGLCLRWRRTGESPIDDELEGISVANREGDSCFTGINSPDELSVVMASLFNGASGSLVVPDAKRLLGLLARKGIPIEGHIDDVGLLSFVAHSQQEMSIAALGRRLLDMSPPGPSSLEPAVAGWEACVALRSHDALRKGMSDEEWNVYERIDLPLAPVLARMESAGVLVDEDQLEEMTQDLAGRMTLLEEEIYGPAGREFNLGSPAQVAEVLFDELEFPPLRKTRKGARSTDESVLSELAQNEAIPDEMRRVPERILEHRALSKLRSTYTQRLPEWIHPHTGRVHTHFIQTEAATGRLASLRPNLQNIPIRTEDGRRIRRSFVTPKGCALVSADYSQIELRLMAHMSGDENLVTAFREGEDIHSATAAEIFRTSPDEVDVDRRRYAKSINFGLIYGMSEFGLAKSLGISKDEARTYMDRYFSRYSGVLGFMNRLREESDSNRYVKTLFGRRIHTPGAQGHAARQAVQRAAINAPLQGTAADLIKKAMVAVDAWLAKEGLQSRMVLQVHDELLLEVPFGEIDQVKSNVSRLMCSVAELDVPLVVDVSQGANWDEAH